MKDRLVVGIHVAKHFCSHFVTWNLRIQRRVCTVVCISVILHLPVNLWLLEFEKRLRTAVATRNGESYGALWYKCPFHIKGIR